MKFLHFLVFAFLIASFSFSEESSNFYFEVTSFNGVNLRAEPGTNSKVITKLDYGAPLRVLGYEKEEVISGSRSMWAKVKSKGIDGYVFAANLGVCNFKTDFLRQVFLDQYALSNASDNYTLLPNTLQFVQSLKNIYCAKFQVIIPKGQDGDEPRWNYAVYREMNGNFSQIFERNTWSFDEPQLLDINGDGLVDMIASFGGCCGTQSHIAICLGTSNGKFTDEFKSVVTPESKNGDFSWEGFRPEQFEYSSSLKAYIIIGARTQKDGKVEPYEYYYDSTINELEWVEHSNI